MKYHLIILLFIFSVIKPSYSQPTPEQILSFFKHLIHHYGHKFRKKNSDLSDKKECSEYELLEHCLNDTQKNIDNECYKMKHIENLNAIIAVAHSQKIHVGSQFKHLLNDNNFVHIYAKVFDVENTFSDSDSDSEISSDDESPAEPPLHYTLTVDITTLD